MAQETNSLCYKMAQETNSLLCYKFPNRFVYYEPIVLNIGAEEFQERHGSQYNRKETE